MSSPLQELFDRLRDGINSLRQSSTSTAITTT